MDAVITYVNGLDPVWQSEYSKCVGMETFLEKRFRDWGTLKYLLRGICVNMPFVRNVYLVVSGDTQVPSWVDREHLRIVRMNPAGTLVEGNITEILLQTL